MARKKKVVIEDFDTMLIRVANECISGKYGTGISRNQAVNSLGYGNIYSNVQKYVNMISTGKL